jgi:hypothetical protein
MKDCFFVSRKTRFFVSGKMEFLVRGTVFGGGKKN